ncbi:slr1658 superfamily regulator [Oleispirillum naphthae]|uniref:slr1658 superfamily regulator n=1 Tax=Oleispirillum naphthae TaxID=2838853 RepID=UPI00308221F2
MGDTFGAFQSCEGEGAALESLLLCFSPSLLPLQQRWRNNGLSADFLSDYVTTFFPKDEADPASATRQSTVKGAVSYIANELLENAMKYSESNSLPITIRLVLQADRIVFEETNVASAASAAAYRRFIGELQQSDPADIYFHKVEAMAVSGDASGLGLITMIIDYAASLAWRFEAAPGGGEAVTTQVCLAV